MTAPDYARDAPHGTAMRGTDEASVLRFLSRASERFAASTDYESTLLAVAGMALPYLGSWCIVDIVGKDGTMRRLGIVHPDPLKQEQATRLTQSWPPHRDDLLGLPLALISRASEVLSEVPDAVLVQVARSDGNLRDLRALGIGSILTVPLLPRGNLLGAITFVSAETGHQYDETDVALAEELGARCGIAVDNARLLRDAEAARAEAEEARRGAVQLNERLIIASVHQQELAEQARDASQLKSRFLSTLSHEVRTPIHAMMGYLDLIELEIDEPSARQLGYMNRMRASGGHLLGLTDDILDLAKIEAGRIEVHEEALAAADAIAAAITLIAPQAAAAGVQVRAECSERASTYLADGDRVRQILVSLLSNALKYTDRGGSVMARCGTTAAPDPGARVPGAGPWSYIRIEDTGIGISANDLSGVFDAFVRVDTANMRKQDGSGLGLAIALELARRMGGDLTLRSVLGEGSCFTLWLPAAEPGVGAG